MSPTDTGSNLQTPLSIQSLEVAAREYAAELTVTPIPSLYGVTDGKAVGTFVEAGFNAFITQRHEHIPGNAAKGIDFPALNVDLKVTSIKQPQSSCPFRDATQKVYGLGYDLLVMVYDKTDHDGSRTAQLQFHNVLMIDRAQTGDFQMTTGLHRLLDSDATVEEIDAFLEDRNLPLDAENRYQLAERIVAEPPALGGLTISNALQWRLQYGRAIGIARAGTNPGIRDLIA